MPAPIPAARPRLNRSRGQKRMRRKQLLQHHKYSRYYQAARQLGIEEAEAKKIGQRILVKRKTSEVFAPTRKAVHRIVRAQTRAEATKRKAARRVTKAQTAVKKAGTGFMFGHRKRKVNKRIKRLKKRQAKLKSVKGKKGLLHPIKYATKWFRVPILGWRIARAEHRVENMAGMDKIDREHALAKAKARKEKVQKRADKHLEGQIKNIRRKYEDQVSGP